MGKLSAMTVALTLTLSLALSFVGALSLSCSYFTKKEPGDGKGVVVRYMNLKAVYSFVLNRNRDAMEVKKKADLKIARLKELDRDLDEPGTDHISLLDEYRQIRSEIDSLRSSSKSYKTKILNQINRAVKNVAAKAKTDLIFNIGDELIYAKTEYDITDEIIREIIRLEERRAPEAR